MPARHTHGGGFLPIPTSPPVLTGWFPLPIGMGGYVTGVRIANDGSLVHWTDVNMGFVFNPGTNKWKQLYTLTGFPKSCVEAFLVAGNNGPPFAQGAYAVEIAPSNSNTIYVVGPFSKDGSNNTLFSVLLSTDKGVTFSATNFTPSLVVGILPVTGSRCNATKMAVDPLNPGIVILAASTDGIWVTTNSGSSWSNPAGVPGAANNSGQAFFYPPGVYCVCFDPTSQSGGTGPCLKAYCYSVGGTTPSMYGTTTGVGGTWAAVGTGGPAAGGINAAHVDPFSGTLWVLDNNGSSGAPAKFWRWNGTNWSSSFVMTITNPSGNILGNEILDFAFDPNLSGHLISQTDTGVIYETLNCTAANPTFKHSVNVTVDYSQMPWQNVFAGANQAGTSGSLCFIPTDHSGPSGQSQSFWTGSNVSIFKCSYVGAIVDNVTNVTYTLNGAGNEEITPTEMAVSPTVGGSTIWLGGWDSGFYKHTQADLNNYATINYPPNSLLSNPSDALFRCDSIDYAVSDPNFVCAVGSENSSFEGYTVNNGADNFTAFGPFQHPPLGGTPPPHQMKCIRASTTTNMCVVTDTSGQPTYFTTDQGLNWTASTLGGGATMNGGSFQLCSDGVTAGTFYLCDNVGNIQQSTDNGATFSVLTVGGDGVSQLGATKLKRTSGLAVDFWAGKTGIDPTQGNNTYLTKSSGSWVGTIVPVGGSVGFGKAAPSKSYPAVYVGGWCFVSSNSTFTPSGAGGGVQIGDTITFSNLVNGNSGAAAYLNFLPGAIVQAHEGSTSIWGTVVSSDSTARTVTITVTDITNPSGTPSSSWSVYCIGIWASDDTGVTWTQLVQTPLNNFAYFQSTDGDMNIYRRVYVQFTTNSAGAYHNP